MAPPNKQRSKGRQLKMTTQTLLDFDLGESSSDSDFRIEDHDESDDDCSENSNAIDSGQDDDDEDEDEESDSDGGSDSASSELKYLLGGSQKAPKDTTELKDILANAAAAKMSEKQIPTNPICCACLGDRSDDTNEIVECDGCGVSVHEGCYGVSDSNSVSSTISSCSTEPWFCEACKAGITDPSCELCPNKGGIFKETDVGKWVHLVCALYVPGVAFGEVDQLTSVTLFEMPYSKWGAKTCSLCEDAKFARTGVCIGCDAGMCKTYFHVTCAQAAGFLSEAHSEEADHADPFYAHCKVHSDKTMIKHRKRNFNTLKLRMEQRKLIKVETKNDKPSAEQLRIQRKLTKHQSKYRANKSLKIEPWVPTQKMPRLLITSATACRRLQLKAELIGIDTAALEFQEAQMTALADVRKKWHIPPAFSVEFIGYYLDRISRLKELKSNLERQIETNKKLITEQQNLREEYDKRMKLNVNLVSKNTSLKEQVNELHKQIETLCPNKSLPSIENIGRPILTPTAVPSPRPMSVPTAAALKMGVGFPINLPGTKDDSGRILSTQRQNSDDLVHECGICKRCNDQHLLAKCDTCHFYYHLGCLNPPLTRHPKKSKLYGWQCSECDKSDDSDVIADLPKGPRKSRTRFSKDGTIVPVDQNTSNNESNTSSKSGTSPGKRKSIDKQPKKERSTERETKNEKTIINTTTTTVAVASVAPASKGSSPQKPKKPKVILTNSKNPLENSITMNSTEDQKKLEIQKDQKIKKDEIKEESCTSSNSTAQNAITEEDPTKLKNKINKKKKEHKPSVGGESSNEDNIKKENSINPQKEGNNTTLNETVQSSSVIEENGEQIQKQSRKRRKEKHKNRYPSDSEKSPSKEHKRKRKKKSHDRENDSNNSVPKIKIKFKTLPLPGEVAPEPHFFYVSADMVRPLDTSRPTSVETVDDSTINADDVSHGVMSPIEDKGIRRTSTPVTGVSLTPTKGDTPTGSASKLKHKAGSKTPVSPTRRTVRKDLTNQLSSCTDNRIKEQICDVCNEPGTNQNLVKCDECGKNYHFTCLDPPLKKTPKRRGYSWHCADCDPTEIEST